MRKTAVKVRVRVKRRFDLAFFGVREKRLVDLALDRI